MQGNCRASGPSLNIDELDFNCDVTDTDSLLLQKKKNLTRTTSEIFRAKHGLLKELVSTKQNS